MALVEPLTERLPFLLDDSLSEFFPPPMVRIGRRHVPDSFAVATAPSVRHTPPAYTSDRTPSECLRRHPQH